MKKHGVSDKTQINQIANYAFLEKTINIIVGDRAPNDYFTVAKEQCKGMQVDKNVGTITNETILSANLLNNCIPGNIDTMDYASYDEFLRTRRKMMAEKIKNYYYTISSGKLDNQ